MAFVKVEEKGSKTFTIRLGAEGQPSEIIGFYIGVKSIKTKFNPDRPSSVHYFVLENGETQSVWGTALLDRKFNPTLAGKLVKIEYLGKTRFQGKSGMVSAHNFDVFVDDTETMDVSKFKYLTESTQQESQPEELVEQVTPKTGSPRRFGRSF